MLNALGFTVAAFVTPSLFITVKWRKQQANQHKQQLQLFIEQGRQLEARLCDDNLVYNDDTMQIEHDVWVKNVEAYLAKNSSKRQLALFSRYREMRDQARTRRSELVNSVQGRIYRLIDFMFEFNNPLLSKIRLFNLRVKRVILMRTLTSV